MTSEATNPDDLPNGSGDGDTNTDAPDTASGGSADHRADRPPVTEQPDTARVDDPSDS